MTTRQLPKRLRKLVADNPDKIEEGHTEQDDFAGVGTWSHWLYLKPGWHNAGLDPSAALHIIHEHTVKECLDLFRQVAACDCDDCSAERKARKS